LILFLFLSVLLAITLTRWGWTRITGRIWKISSGWDGLLEDKDQESLLGDSNGSSNETCIATVAEAQGTPSWELDEGRISLEEWIATHPKSIY
jgi:hypothetical protein